jgi:hypothetical protein
MAAVACGSDGNGGAGAGGAGGAGMGGSGGAGGTGAIGGTGGSGPTTATIRIVHMNLGVAMVDLVDGGETTVLEASFMSGEVSGPLVREAGPRTFDFLGPGEGDLRFSTREQTFEAGKEYVLVLLPDPSDSMPNANQTLVIEIDRSPIDAGDAGLILVHGSEISAFDPADITLREIEAMNGIIRTLETAVRIGTRTTLESLEPGEYEFGLVENDPMNAPATLLAPRMLTAGELVIAVAGEALVSTTDVDGVFALSLDAVSGRDTLELLGVGP